MRADRQRLIRMITLISLRRTFMVAGFALAAACLRGTEAGVEFVGFFWDDQVLVFGLRDKANGGTKWVSAGQEYAGYTARSLDEKTSTLTVTKDKADFRLPLIAAGIKQVASELAPELKKKILNNLRQLSAAADQFYLENGVDKTTFDELVGRTKYVKEIKAVDGEDYRGLRFAQGKKIEVTTQQGYIISYQP
jgi:hypothetical protein